MPRPAALCLIFTLCSLACACGTDGAERAGAQAPTATGSSAARGARGGATLTGTVIDAESGAPVAGATVEGPGGRQTTSDARGRFSLSLPVGTEGELVASTTDGARGANRLRPLRAGTLEVVLRLSRP